MKLSDAIDKRLNYFMGLNNIRSWWGLYKVTGVPKSTINSNFSSKETKVPSLPTLIQICNGLNTNLKDFFNDEMFTDIDDDL